MSIPSPTRNESSDQEIVARILAGDSELFEILMRRYNTRLYRAVRAIIGDVPEVEDVMQQAYIDAYAHLDQFAERAAFSTWLTRIAVHEALRRARTRDHRREADPAQSGEERFANLESNWPSPEQEALSAEMQRLLESAIATLPQIYRAVFVLRDVDGMSGRDTAEVLELSGAAVRTRLHRARSLLREHLHQRADISLSDLFQFADPRCDRIVKHVLEVIGPHPLGAATA